MSVLAMPHITGQIEGNGSRLMKKWGWQGARNYPSPKLVTSLMHGALTCQANLIQILTYKALPTTLNHFYSKVFFLNRNNSLCFLGLWLTLILTLKNTEQ